MFRRRFWVSLLLTVPVVVTSEMVMDWFGYTLHLPGTDVWVAGPRHRRLLLGRVAVPRGRPGARLATAGPGMMLLISMAITVAFAASMATSVGWFDLDFWWELAALVTIMLLGHWQEMKAIGQAQGALAALAELLPDEAERVDPDGIGRARRRRRPAPSATWCWCGRADGCRPTARSSTARPSSTSR